MVYSLKNVWFTLLNVTDKYLSPGFIPHRKMMLAHIFVDTPLRLCYFLHLFRPQTILYFTVFKSHQNDRVDHVLRRIRGIY